MATKRDNLLENLTIDQAGWDYARSLSIKARGAVMAQAISEMRTKDAERTSKAQFIVILIASCQNKDEATASLNEAKPLLKLFGSDDKSKGAFSAKTDKTFTVYRSTLLSAFDYGVLPSTTYLSEGEIRKRTTEARKASRKVEADKIAKAVNESASAESGIPTSELVKQAHAMHQQFADWVIHLPAVLQIKFFQSESFVKLVDDTKAAHKAAVDALKGANVVQVSEPDTVGAEPAQSAAAGA